MTNSSRLRLHRSIRGIIAIIVLHAGAEQAFALQGPMPGAVSASKLKLPDGPGSVRGLADAASLNVFSAQVSYSVPIQLPRGRGGFGPELAISYSGELGNGPIGLGFTIGEIAIRRSLRHGVPAYENTDELELVGIEGAGRLIPDANTPETWWVEGKGKDLRVQRSGSGMLVTNANGLRYTLGTVVSSRIQGLAAGALGTGIATWLVEDVEDLSGQHVTYSYQKLENQLYLSQIQWGPSPEGNAGSAYRADFVYEPRPDPVVSYRTGLEVQTSQRLASIRITSFGETLRTYALTYDSTFALSRLSKITMTGRGEKGQWPAITFGYVKPKAAQLVEISNPEGWVLNARGTTLADVDGDGLNDLLRVEVGGSSWRRNRGGRFDAARILSGGEVDFDAAQIADLDGDLRPDLIRVVGNTWRVSTLVGGLVPTGWSAATEVPGTSLLPLNSSSSTFADLDADGRVELLTAGTNGYNVGMNGPLGFLQTIRSPIDPDNAFVAPGAANLHFRDVNGDGIADVVWLTDAWANIYLGSGAGRFVRSAKVEYPWGSAVQNLADIRLADLNRDGLMDLIRITSANVHFYPGLANGSFGVERASLPRPQGFGVNDVVTVSDLNGNGSEDIVWSSSSGAMWLLDLAGPTHAGMLEQIDNGLGLTTVFSYAASTELLVKAENDGRPWTRFFPAAIPIPISSRTELASGQPARISELTVRDGFWDREERRFGGFLEASRIARGNTPERTLVETSAFHEGVAEARILRGQPLALEYSDGRGRQFSRSESQWEALPVSGLPNNALTRRVFLRSQRLLTLEGQVDPVEAVSTFTPDESARSVRETHTGRSDRSGDEKIITRVFADDAATWVRNRLCEEKIFAGDGTTLVEHKRVIMGDEKGPATAADGEPCGVGKGWVLTNEAWLVDTKANQSRFVVQEASSYDVWGNATIVYAEGVRRMLSYDALGLYPSGETVNPGSSAPLEWSATWDKVVGQPTTVSDPNRVTSTITYDELGRVVAMAVGDHAPHIRYYYNWTAPRPTTTTFLFDRGLADVPQNTGASSGGWRETIAVANGAGESLLSATRLSGDQFIITQFSDLDARGDVISIAEGFYHRGATYPVTRPADGLRIQTFSRDALGRVLEQTLPNGAKKLMTYEPYVTVTTGADLASVTTITDAFNRIVHTYRDITTDGTTVREEVTATYDAADRITAMSLQNGKAIHRFEYDTLGRLVEASDPDIGMRTMAYDEANRLIRHENGAGQVVGYGYDGAGRLTSKGPGEVRRGATDYRFQYDTPHPESASRTFTKGRLAWVAEPGNGRTEYAYDLLGRETMRTRRFADGATATENRTLGASGLLLTREQDGFDITPTYDAAGRVIRIGAYWSAEPGEDGRLGLDATGRVLRETYGNGTVQVYDYDTLGLPQGIVLESAAKSPWFNLSVARNAYGAPTAIVDKDGRGLDHSATYAFDPAARLVNASIGSGPAAFRFSFRYDGLQNLVRRTIDSGSASGVFAGEYRLGGEGFGPRQLATVMTAPGASTVRSFGYDKAGRQTKDGARALVFDGFDQLTGVSGEGIQGIEYTYDHDGLRDTAATAANTDRWFAVDHVVRHGQREHVVMVGGRPVARVVAKATADMAAAGTAAGLALQPRLSPPRLRSWGGLAFGLMVAMVLLFAALKRSGRRLHTVVASATLFCFAFSASGCAGPKKMPAVAEIIAVTYLHQGVAPGPIVVTDSNGALVTERRFEPFGAALDSAGPDGIAVPGADFKLEPWNALNKETDPETGWSYHGARWMASNTARWLTPDPPTKAPDAKYLAMPWDLNPYQYVRQNPTLFWDPDGRETVAQLIGRMGVESYGNGGNTAATYGWAALGAVWELIGAESLSRVADTGFTGDTQATAGDYVMAVIELAPVIAASAKPAAAALRGAGRVVSKVGEVASAGAKKFSEAVSAGVRKVLGSGATRGGAQAGAQAAKVPTTAFGKAVEALKAGDKAWSRVTAHAEGATGRAYKGATSIEEVFEHAQTGERMVRHTIVRGEEVLHETYRTYAKFGAQ